MWTHLHSQNRWYICVCVVYTSWASVIVLKSMYSSEYNGYILMGAQWYSNTRWYGAYNIYARCLCKCVCLCGARCARTSSIQSIVQEDDDWMDEYTLILVHHMVCCVQFEQYCNTILVLISVVQSIYTMTTLVGAHWYSYIHQVSA